MRALAELRLDPDRLPLSSTARWHLAAWLKELAEGLVDGTLDEGDSKQGFVYHWPLYTEVSS